MKKLRAMDAKRKTVWGFLFAVMLAVGYPVSVRAQQIDLPDLSQGMSGVSADDLLGCVSKIAIGLKDMVASDTRVLTDGDELSAFVGALSNLETVGALRELMDRCLGSIGVDSGQLMSMLTQQVRNNEAMRQAFEGVRVAGEGLADQAETIVSSGEIQQAASDGMRIAMELLRPIIEEIKSLLGQMAR